MYLRPTLVSVLLCVWWIRISVPVVLAVYVTGLFYVSSSDASDKIILFNIWSVVFLFFVGSNFLYLSLLLIPGLFRVRIRSVLGGGEYEPEGEDRFSWLVLPEMFASVGSRIASRTPWRGALRKAGVVVQVRMTGSFSNGEVHIDGQGVQWSEKDRGDFRELRIAVPWMSAGRILLRAAFV